MADRQPSKFVRHVAMLCLDQLRAKEWVKAEEIKAPCATVTVRRALTWLKEQLGEDGLWTGPEGYCLRYRDFTLGDAAGPTIVVREVEKLVEVERVVERIVEVPTFAGDLSIASTKALMDELVRRGWILDARKEYAA